MSAGASSELQAASCKRERAARSVQRAACSVQRAACTAHRALSARRPRTERPAPKRPAPGTPPLTAPAACGPCRLRLLPPTGALLEGVYVDFLDPSCDQPPLLCPDSHENSRNRERHTTARASLALASRSRLRKASQGRGPKDSGMHRQNLLGHVLETLCVAMNEKREKS